MSRVAFQTSQTTFSRFVTVEVSESAERWRQMAGQEIRGAPALGQGSALAFDIAETYGRAWRVTVLNRNDAPIPDLWPVLLMAQRRVLWRPEARESYRLIYGHPRARAPQYDLAARTEPRLLDAAPLGSVGAEIENTAWVDPTPWTERYAAVLWIALILASVTLGAVAVMTLRQGVRDVSGQDEILS